MFTRRQILGAAAAACVGRPVAAQEAAAFAAEREEGWISVRNPAGEPVLRYLREAVPSGEKGPSVEGGGFVHPVHTPAGLVVTDLAPADHPHHRGLFFGWVQVSGVAPGDWWGWGAKAPKEGRAIVNREARVTDAGPKGVVLRLINSWRADEETVLRERLTLTAGAAPGCHVLDFEYKFTSPVREAVVVAQSPFGGFCYRGRPLGQLEVTGPDGPVTFKDSVHTRSETNWPPTRWYDFTYRGESGVGGAAVMDHPGNPLSSWHGVRSIHMLNPCIVAEDPVEIPFGEPLFLRYRLVAHDGPAAAVDLPALYEAFSNAE
jgi:hypothetical protein